MNRKLLLAPALAGLFLCSCVFGQDQPSLGDVARKQRRANTTASTPHATHVVTNEDIPQKMILTSNKSSDRSTPVQYYGGSGGNAEVRDRQAKYLQDSIRAQKQNIAYLKSRLAELEKQAGETDQSSGQASSGGTGGCGIYRQACNNARRLQYSIDSIKSQIDASQKNLEQVQEQVRKMGYGNAVYDPD